MLGMPTRSKVACDTTSVYDGIMLKFRKNLSMAGMARCGGHGPGGASSIGDPCQEKESIIHLALEGRCRRPSPRFYGTKSKVL